MITKFKDEVIALGAPDELIGLCPRGFKHNGQPFDYSVFLNEIDEVWAAHEVILSYLQKGRCINKKTCIGSIRNSLARYIKADSYYSSFRITYVSLGATILALHMAGFKIKEVEVEPGYYEVYANFTESSIKRFNKAVELREKNK